MRRAGRTEPITQPTPSEPLREYFARFNLVLHAAQHPDAGLRLLHEWGANLCTWAVDVLVGRVRRQLKPTDDIKTVRRAGDSSCRATRMRKRRHSLSGRLLLLFIVATILLAFIVRSRFRVALYSNMEQMAAPHLIEYVQYLLDTVGHRPDPGKAAALGERLPLRIYLAGTHD